jgi:glucose-induced degradation protein 8
MNSATVNDADLNSLVLNYLTVEGYKAAADAFVVEADVAVRAGGEDDDDVAVRSAIRSAVHRGDVVRGIEQLNDFQPDLLERDEALGYALQLQRLVELVRGGQSDTAVLLARSELAPRAVASDEWLEQLERTMALLAFADVRSDALPDALRELLLDERRIGTANQLNAAILRAQGSDAESRLRTVLKTIKWCEAELAKARIAHPTLDQLLQHDAEPN